MKKILLCLFTAVLFPSLALTANAPANFQEGVNYKLIQPEQPTGNDDKIEVIEMFWYGCPHCHRFQPFVERWLKTKPDNVEYVRMPAILRDSWTLHAKAFYAAEALNVLEKIHAPMFDAIHNQKRRLATEQEVMEFFAEQGVSNEDFRKAFHSFTVDSKVRRARLMTSRYGVHGTPSVVINGRYLTDSGMAKGGYSGWLKVIDFLVKKESGSSH